MRDWADKRAILAIFGLLALLAVPAGAAELPAGGIPIPVRVEPATPAPGQATPTPVPVMAPPPPGTPPATIDDLDLSPELRWLFEQAEREYELADMPPRLEVLGLLRRADPALVRQRRARDQKRAPFNWNVLVPTSTRDRYRGAYARIEGNILKWQPVEMAANPQGIDTVYQVTIFNYDETKLYLVHCLELPLTELATDDNVYAEGVWVQWTPVDTQSGERELMPLYLANRVIRWDYDELNPPENALGYVVLFATIGIIILALAVGAYERRRRARFQERWQQKVREKRDRAKLGALKGKKKPVADQGAGEGPAAGDDEIFEPGGGEERPPGDGGDPA